MAVPPLQTAGDGLQLTVAEDRPHARVLVGGELDAGTAPRLTRLLRSLEDAGCRWVDLDLSRLTFLAAAGLTVFWEATVRLQEAGGGLRLTAVTPRSHRILRITGLDTVLDVHLAGSAAPVPCRAVTTRAST